MQIIKFLKFTLLSTVLMCVSSHAADSCFEIAKSFKQLNDSGMNCTCGAQLKNIFAPVHSSFKLVAACNLRWPGNGVVDLKREKVFLDRPSLPNDYPDGVVFFLGEVILDGKIRLNLEEDNGARNFYPDIPISKPHKGNPSVFNEIHIDAIVPGEQLFRKRKNIKNVCARASVKITNLMVVMGDIDEAGVHPSTIQFQRLERLKPC
jgi:hypothetical protein